MQLLTNTKIDFMKYRKVFVWLSLALLLTAAIEIMFLTGINFGIDFKGGTQLTLKLQEDTSIDQLRNIMADAGIREANIQRFGAAEDNEVLIKAPVVEGSEEGSGSAIIDALNVALNGNAAAANDLNQRGASTFASLLTKADPDNQGADLEIDQYYQEIGDAVIARRQELSIFSSWDDVRSTVGLSPAAADVLEEQGSLGAFAIRQNDSVGPQIGSELRVKGVLAVVMSLLGMLMYIWYRFELRFGIGALVAVFHDFLITIGLFAIMNYEFNLPTIAAFLTLVGYSVNDTVVIFDRVRENMRRHRRKRLVDIMNLSINQTLSRTILTSGTTMLVVGCLFFLGGEVLRGFSFVLLIGIIIGTYSSIFVASPFALLWEQMVNKREARGAHPSKKVEAT